MTASRIWRRGDALEGLAVGLIAGALIVIEIAVMGAWSVFTRPLWLDEIHTLLVSSNGDVGTSMRALAAGADFNPPALFLFYRLVGIVSGGLSEVPMRLVALGSVLVSLPFVYLLLRDEVGRFAAGLAALSVWTQPIVAGVAFDARFYGPWLALIAGLLFMLRRVVEGRPMRFNGVVVAVLSILLCTIHYFGIVAWMAAVGVAVMIAPTDRRVVIRRLVPALAGPLALALCIPLYLGQRAALSIPTWVPKATVGDHLFLLAVVLLPVCLIVALLAWGASSFLRRGTPNEHVPAPLQFRSGGLLLLGQATVPLALACFSLFVQPATQQRYWIAGALAVAPVVAMAVSRSLPGVRIAVAATIVVLSGVLIRGEGKAARDRAAEFATDAGYARRALAERRILVVRRRHTLYPLLRAEPAATRGAMLMDAESSGADSSLITIDRDVARVHERFYGFPHLASPRDLESSSSFLFLEIDPARTPSERDLPGRSIEAVAPRLFLVRRP